MEILQSCARPSISIGYYNMVQLSQGQFIKFIQNRHFIAHPHMRPRYGLPVASLTYWGWDNMAVILQTAFPNAFSWMKMYEFWIKFHWSLFLRFLLTIFQHWYRWWLGADQVTSLYLNQWWPTFLTCLCVTQWVKVFYLFSCQVACKRLNVILFELFWCWGQNNLALEVNTMPAGIAFTV